MLRPAIHQGVLTLTLLLSSACSGSLRYQIDDSTIADLPQSEKQNLARRLHAVPGALRRLARRAVQPAHL